MSTQPIDRIEIVERIVEAALYNEEALTQVAKQLKTNVERLNTDISTSMAEQVTASVVEAVDELIAEAGDNIGKAAIKQLCAATQEADTATQAYKRAASEAKSASESIIWKAIICSLVVSATVSTVIALLLRH